MSKRLVWCVMLCAVLLLTAAGTAAASVPRRVTGGITFQSPWFWFIDDPQMKGWMQIDAWEIGPNGQATGMWQVQLYKASWGGWRRLDGRVVQLDDAPRGIIGIWKSGQVQDRLPICARG